MLFKIAQKTASTRLNNCMKVVQDPFKTTVKGLTDANVRVACSRIQDKIVMYGLCSDREWAYYQRHTNGQINQKEAFS